MPRDYGMISKDLKLEALLTVMILAGDQQNAGKEVNWRRAEQNEGLVTFGILPH